MKMFIDNKKKLILILFIFSVLFADDKNQIKIVSNNTNSKFLNRNNFYNNTYLQLSLNYEKSGNVFTLYPSISNSSLSIDQFIFSKKIN